MTETVDKREEMALQLLMRGHATMRELLTMAFGEWPPKGLDVNPAILHGQPVKLYELTGGKVMGLGQAFKDTQSESWIKADVSASQEWGSLYSTLAHEFVHILQGDHSYRLQKDLFHRFLDSFRSEDPIASNVAMAKVISSGDNPISKQFNAIAVPRGERMINYMRQQALREGTEMQARLNQILADGYPRWGRLPSTIDEFHAAMANAGVDLPEPIKAKLAALPDGASAKTFLNAQGEKGKGIDDRIHEIHKVVHSLEEKSQDQFWNKGVLEIYADLIEMYGDKQGRERFGLGKNPKADIPLKRYPGQKPA